MPLFLIMYPFLLSYFVPRSAQPVPVSVPAPVIPSVSAPVRQQQQQPPVVFAPPVAATTRPQPVVAPVSKPQPAPVSAPASVPAANVAAAPKPKALTAEELRLQVCVASFFAVDG